MLAPGARVGALEVIGPLGAGGMGQVYRARDEKLGREVALKALSDPFVQDRGRLSRFEREARALAALNHPGIAAIYGVEQSGEAPLLVLELVHGRTLEERLHRGPLPTREALEIARQLAEALEHAHEKGIVHRDLKPSNVMLTEQGRAKILDFGLARMLEREPALTSAETYTCSVSDASGAGAVLGTGPYMSPEQARGEAVDRRADVWAFGCVLYEMLSGRRAFPGATFSDTIAAVLEREPDWSAVPGATPGPVRSLLRRCLQKDAGRRLRDMGDARIELEEALEGAAAGATATGGPSGRRPRPAWVLPAAALALLAALTALAVVSYRLARARMPRRLTLTLPLAPAAGSGPPSISVLAVSPDGRTVVHVGPEGLLRRDVDATEPELIPGTAGAHSPFFSPDGRWLGLWQGGKLKKLSLEGGAPIDLCPAPSLRGASWGDDGTIVFSPGAWSGLWRVRAEGGTCEELTRPGPGEPSHRWPQVLPGSRAILAARQGSSAREEDRRIAVFSVVDRTWRDVLRGAGLARYHPGGHLLFGQGGTLFAVPFDPRAAEIRGSPVPLAEAVGRNAEAGMYAFEVSASGAVAYMPFEDRPGDASLLWVDRAGREEPVVPERRAYSSPRLSPDGRSLAVEVHATDGYEIWLLDLERRAWTRLAHGKDNFSPVFSPDGRQLAFASNRAGSISLHAMPVDAGAEPRRLLDAARSNFPSSWSPDGSHLLFVDQHPETNFDLWLLPLRGDGRPRPFLATTGYDADGVFSPDGRWVAYASRETGRTDVYVRSSTGEGPKWLVSRESAGEPAWSRDGRELFYRTGGRRPKLMVVPVDARSGVRFGEPRALFDDSYAPGSGPYAGYDAAADGRRFLMVEQADRPPGPHHIVLIPDAAAELHEKASPRSR